MHQILVEGRGGGRGRRCKKGKMHTCSTQKGDDDSKDNVEAIMSSLLEYNSSKRENTTEND
jgi:hypothetical protein